jgi:hypothetical protein
MDHPQKLVFYRVVRANMFEEVGVVLPGRLNARDLLLLPAFHWRR